MLYQKGEKLKVLKETIKDIPKLSELEETHFIMSEKQIKEFEEPIHKIFNELNNVLYNTLISLVPTDKKVDTVCKVVERVVSYLNEHYEEDLVNNFNEKKLSFYENMFVILVRDELCSRYREYKEILISIPETYWNLRRTKEVPKFTNISCLISDYQDISKDIQTESLYEQTETYLTHCLELILEKISELIKDECKMEFLCPDVLPNRLRHLIYLLKSELPLDLETEE